MRAEVRTALKDSRLQQRILPVTTDDTKPSAIGDLLAELHSLDARNSTDLAEEIFKLLAAQSQGQQTATG